MLQARWQLRRCRDLRRRYCVSEWPNGLAEDVLHIVQAPAKRVFDRLKAAASRLLYHTCGSVVGLMDDLVEMGVTR